ncbi:MAG: protein kinase [Planctomycetes bacterium]|nr:protein kinase [Planctomycetota bacterium]
MHACPTCRADVPTGSRFCPACGVALQQPTLVTHGHTLVGGSSILTDSGPEDAAGSSSGIDHGQFVPGTILGERYRIVGRLGRGGMGEIYRADDLKLGTSIALKFLPLRFAKRQDRLERLHGEVRLARQIAHANVCRVYDIGDHEGQPFITMEYIDGEDLASLLRRIGRLPRDKAIEIARQICAGVAAAHERGILHRDLKPANVMIDGRGQVRITDFGLAALVEDAGDEPRAGTPAYMAPEQLRMQDVTVRSDIYSVGLVLYEAFCGRKAFEATTISELQRAHADHMPSRPSVFIEGFDPAIERAIFHCLEPDPRERPASMLAVLAALPGGDPLAAALAAGETPSPELVAAAAHAEGMPAVVCLACLIVILIGVAAFPFLNDQIKLHAFARLDKSPEVLADRARQFIHSRLGLADRNADHDFGFRVNGSYLSRIEEFDRSPLRWSALTAGGPTAMEFWYRQSPGPMIPSNDQGWVTEDDPPTSRAGMIDLRFDPSGALDYLLVVPTARDLLGAPQPDYEWGGLFSDTGLTLTRFETIDPSRWIPPVFSDQRFIWRGLHPNNPDVRLRVEAAALAGRPVYFRVAPDWVEPSKSGWQMDPGENAWSQLGNVLVFAAALIGASIMARRNLRLNRGDRRGALRISFFIAAVMLARWLLQADHVPDAAGQLAIFIRGAGRALYLAALCWLFYIALEPHLRRRWPDMLISWSRLLRGRLRDPLVGRDILIGGLFGIFGMVATAMRYFGPGWFGNPPPRPAAVPVATFLGLRYDLAELLGIMTNALFQPMLVLVVLLILIVLLRKRWLAQAVFFVLVTWQMTRLTIQQGGNAYVDLAYYGLILWALLFVSLRFGLLALMFALLYVLILDSYPVTTDMNAWYRDSSWFALATLSILTLYGYFTALAGRPLVLLSANSYQSQRVTNGD